MILHWAVLPDWKFLSILPEAQYYRTRVKRNTAIY